MSLYTVSSESSVCCSPSNDTLMREFSIGGAKSISNPRSLVRLHLNDSNKPESTVAAASVVAVDYSKQMEALRDRNSTLERYKMLVNKVRLTPAKARNSGTAQSTQLHSEPLAAQEKAANGNKINYVATAATMMDQAADTSAFDASLASSKDQRFLKEQFTICTKCAGCVRGVAPRSADDFNLSTVSFQKLASQAEDAIQGPPDDGEKHVHAPAKELHDDADCKQTQELNTQPLILPEPIVFPSNLKRDSIRPDYEPVTSRHNWHDEMHSNSSSLLKLNTNLEVQLSASVDSPLLDQNVHLLHTDEEEPQQPSKTLKSNKNSAVKCQMGKKGEKDKELNSLHQSGLNERRIPGNGSQTAFWIRPSSALYEMTASVAAKRKNSTRMESSNEGESVERARFSTSCSSKSLSETSLHNRCPQFTTYFSTHRALTKSGDSKTPKMSAPSSNRTAPNICLVSPRTPSLSYDLSALAKPSHLSSTRLSDSQSSTVSVVLLSSKNKHDASSIQSASSRRRRLAASDSIQSSSALPSTAGHQRGKTAKGKAVLTTRSNNRGSDVHANEAPAASIISSKQSTSALKLYNASPKAMPRKRSVSFDTSQSEVSELAIDPVPDGMPPKATPLNLSSSVTVSARSSSSAVSKGRANHSITTPTSALKSPAPEKRDSVTPLRHFLVNDDKQNLNSTSMGKDGVELEKSKLAGCCSTTTNTQHLSPADPSLIEMDKENIYKGNVYALNRNPCPQGRLYTLGARLQLSTNEMVGSMLQGIIQQTRRVLPCYLCAEMINATTYHVHIEVCRKITEALMEEHAIPPKVRQKIEIISRMTVPISSSSQEECDSFAMACYKCVLHLVIPCQTCGTRIRIHDVKEHQMLCGKAYYESSKAAQRVRKAAEHILSHATDEE